MKRTRLLINEPPLQVLPSLAEAIGLNEAIVIQQLHYWLEDPRFGVEIDGERWIFNTYEEWAEKFTFWSVPTIKRVFLGLEKAGLIVSEQFGKKNHDMRKYYRIDYDKLDTMDGINLIPSNGSKPSDDNKVIQRIPSEITQGEKQDNSRERRTHAKNRGLDLVDGILYFEKNGMELEKNGRTWRGRENFPESLWPLADATARIFGPPAKKYQSGWLAELSDWHSRGATPTHVEKAGAECATWSIKPTSPMGGFGNAVRRLVAETKNKTETFRVTGETELEKIQKSNLWAPAPERK